VTVPWVRVGLAVIALGAVVMVARGLDPAAVGDALSGVDLALVAVAAATMVLGKLGAKLGRSQRVVDDVAAAAGVPSMPWPTTARLLLSAHAAGLLAWAPLGFTVRTLGLRDHGLSLPAIARVHIVERLAEIAALVLVGAAAIAVAPAAAAHTPSELITGALIAAIAAAALIAAALVSSRVRTWARELRGLGRTLVAAGGWAAIAAAADVVVMAIAARAAGLHLGLPAVMLAFVAVNASSAAPVAPAQIGVQETAVVVALAGAGVPTGPALACALAYRAAHMVPLIVLGLPSLASLGLLRPRRLARAPSRS